MSKRVASVAKRVAIGELVDLARLGSAGLPPSARELRAALPRGWILDEDPRFARRDLRLLFREGWILLLALVAFGSVGLAFLLGATPRGWGGILRVVVMIALVLLVGGLVGPIVTRTLVRRSHAPKPSHRAPPPHHPDPASR